MKIPNPESIIDVYHPHLNGVRMRFITRDPHTKTRIICEFREIEYSVKVGEVYIGNKKIQRWEAEEI